MTVTEDAITLVFRAESGRILATLIRVFGDFDVAEEALQDAAAVALERWPEEGVPSSPTSWITTTARRKAIDALRRANRRDDRESAAGRDPAVVADYADHFPATLAQALTRSGL